MIMTKLASAGIPSEDVIKKMHQLSYWQRVKIRFIQLMSQAYECLILDEPTNHLDIDTRESLEAMLVNYEWALIVVSHDQWFVEKIATNRERKIEEGLMMEVE
jgi:macrolide transport system ATP-binding/permease protein